MNRGLYLVDEPGGKLALTVSRTRHSGLRVEAMAPRRESAAGLLAELRVAMRAHSVYRGRVLSLSAPGSVP